MDHIKEPQLGGGCVVWGTQNDFVLFRLRQGFSITQKQAMEKYGIGRLASRIDDLHKMGIKTEVKMVPVKNRFGDKVYVAEYRLKGVK